jgi:hypothetical protein
MLRTKLTSLFLNSSMRLLAAHRKPWSPEGGREALAWLCFFKIEDFNSPCMHLIDFKSKAQDCHPEGEDDKNVVFVRRVISYNLVLLLKSVLLKLSLFLTSRILKED